MRRNCRCLVRRINYAIMEKFTYVRYPRVTNNGGECPRCVA